jgi:hypothetical protein
MPNKLKFPVLTKGHIGETAILISSGKEGTDHCVQVTTRCDCQSCVTNNAISMARLAIDFSTLAGCDLQEVIDAARVMFISGYDSSSLIDNTGSITKH